MKQHLTAFNKAIGFISASIEQVAGITKPQKKFLNWLFEKWIMLPVRHNFLNIYRYGNGGYSEKSIRHQFSRKINFPGWFQTAMGSLQKKNVLSLSIHPTLARAAKRPMARIGFGAARISKQKPVWR